MNASENYNEFGVGNLSFSVTRQSRRRKTEAEVSEHYLFPHGLNSWPNRSWRRFACTGFVGAESPIVWLLDCLRERNPPE